VSGKQYTVRGELIENRDEVYDGLRDYFKQYPKHAKYFGVRLDPTGQPSEDDLSRVADERVIIRLHPEGALSFGINTSMAHSGVEPRRGEDR
jgi:hypothetical protein